MFYEARPAPRYKTGADKSKAAALLLAIFLTGLAFVYTYREDGSKFWSLAGWVVANSVIVSLWPAWFAVAFIWGLAIHISIIVMAARRPGDWYINYNRHGDAVRVREAAKAR